MRGPGNSESRLGLSGGGVSGDFISYLKPMVAIMRCFSEKSEESLIFDTVVVGIVVGT